MDLELLVWCYLSSLERVCILIILDFGVIEVSLELVFSLLWCWGGFGVLGCVR